jgi:hypothetical protein
MQENKSKNDADTTRIIKKLTLPDGFRVGILNLDNILKEVAELKLTDTQTIKTELLNRTKNSNYLPSSAEDEYSAALYQEYQRKFGSSGEGKDEKPQLHKHTPG